MARRCSSLKPAAAAATTATVATIMPREIGFLELWLQLLPHVSALPPLCPSNRLLGCGAIPDAGSCLKSSSLPVADKLDHLPPREGGAGKSSRWVGPHAGHPEILQARHGLGDVAVSLTEGSGEIPGHERPFPAAGLAHVGQGGGHIRHLDLRTEAGVEPLELFRASVGDPFLLRAVSGPVLSQSLPVRPVRRQVHGPATDLPDGARDGSKE
jgi:hypothetical protein